MRVADVSAALGELDPMGRRTIEGSALSALPTSRASSLRHAGQRACGRSQSADAWPLTASMCRPAPGGSPISAQSS